MWFADPPLALLAVGWGMPALVAMFVGIAAMLQLRSFGRDLPRMDCAGDICRS